MNKTKAALHLLFLTLIALFAYYAWDGYERYQEYHSAKYELVEHYKTVFTYRQDPFGKLYDYRCDTLDIVLKYNSDTLIFQGERSVGFKPLRLNQDSVLLVQNQDTKLSMKRIVYTDTGEKVLITYDGNVFVVFSTDYGCKYK